MLLLIELVTSDVIALHTIAIEQFYINNSGFVFFYNILHLNTLVSSKIAHAILDYSFERIERAFS